MTTDEFIDKLNTDLSTSITYEEQGDQFKVKDAGYIGLDSVVISASPTTYPFTNKCQLTTDMG